MGGIGGERRKALVFDILFSDADLARPEGDQYFADAIRANNNLYFPMLRLNDANQSSGIPLAQYGAALGIMAGPAANPKARVSLVLPLPAMVESGRIGVHNAVADNDGVVRGYPLYLDDEGWHIPSLPARVATGLGYTLPGGSDIVLNWHGRALSYQRVSYAEIYADLQRKQPQRIADEFSNKIVIIGATANGLHDVRATPINSFYTGVEILATAIDNLKNANPLRRASPAVPAAFGLFLLAMLALAFVIAHTAPLCLGLLPDRRTDGIYARTQGA